MDTEHRAKLYSTNPIERLNGEIKRRTNVVGIFPNEAADSDDAGRLFRSDPGHHSDMMPAGLLMSPAAHQIHHDTLQRDFATNCGWSNPVINRLFVTLRVLGLLGDEGLTPAE